MESCSPVELDDASGANCGRGRRRKIARAEEMRAEIVLLAADGLTNRRSRNGLGSRVSRSRRGAGGLQPRLNAWSMSPGPGARLRRTAIRPMLTAHRGVEGGNRRLFDAPTQSQAFPLNQTAEVS